jgi:hypothetical protein
VKVSANIVEEFVVPFRVTDHEPPVGNPDSVKVTVYVDLVGVGFVNVTLNPTAFPSTDRAPRAGFAVYPDGGFTV